MLFQRELTCPRHAATAPRTWLRARRMLAVLLVFALAITSLSGCRYSETLLETVLDPINGTLEPDSPPEYKEVDGAPEDPTRASVKLTDNENLADQDTFLPVYKEDAPADGEAHRRTHQEQVDDEVDASEGDEVDEQQQEESTATGNDQEQEPEDSEAASGGGDESQETGDADESQVDQAAGRGGVGKTYGDGTYEELPEATAVAAKGRYALIAQMLGGQGALGGADAAWIADVQAKGIFPNEGVESIPAVWGADGALDMDALVASEADALLVDGVDVVLSAEQSDAVLAAGIDIVNVPALGEAYTSDSDIITAVKVVGQVLSGYVSHASYDTAAMVERYLELHDTAIQGCVNANGGYSYKMVAGIVYQGIYQGSNASGEVTANLSDVRVTTACIDSWTPASAGTMTANRSFSSGSLYLDGETVDTSDGVGLSATALSGGFVLSDYYLQVSGVVNNAYDTARPSSTDSSSGLTLPYAVVPGDDKGLAPRALGTRQTPSALWYPVDGVTFGSTWLTVGDESFPAVIVRTSDIADNIVASASKSNGLYNVGQPYDIYTVPTGMAGSWLDGTVESYLLAPWAYGMFQEGGATDTASEWIDGFYQLFYRVEGASGLGIVEGLGAVSRASCPTA